MFGGDTYHGNAVRRGDHVPGQQDIVRSVGSEETSDDGRYGRVDGERKLLDRVGQLRRDVDALLPARVGPQGTVQRGGEVSEQLPRADVLPVGDAPVRGDRVAVGEPAPPDPVPAPDLGVPVRQLGDQDDDAGEHDGKDADKLGGDEELVEAGAGPCADRVCQVHDHHDEHGQQLVQDAGRPVRHPRGGEDALHKDDGQDGQRGGHDGDDPRPGREVPKHVAVDVLEVGLHAALARDGGAQLGHGAGSRPGQDAADQPHGERDTRRGHVCVDGAGRGEDAAADYDADDYGEGVQRAQVPGEASRLVSRHRAGG